MKNVQATPAEKYFSPSYGFLSRTPVIVRWDPPGDYISLEVVHCCCRLFRVLWYILSEELTMNDGSMIEHLCDSVCKII